MQRLPKVEDCVIQLALWIFEWKLTFVAVLYVGVHSTRDTDKEQDADSSLKIWNAWFPSGPECSVVVRGSDPSVRMHTCEAGPARYQGV